MTQKAIVAYTHPRQRSHKRRKKSTYYNIDNMRSRFAFGWSCLATGIFLIGFTGGFFFVSVTTKLSVPLTYYLSNLFECGGIVLLELNSF